MTERKTLQDWLSYIEGIHPKTWDFGLARVREVAVRMGFESGDVEGAGGLKLPCPLITVGGTNGKGSTCAMLESIYGQAGYKTAVHTSPHLVKFEERLRLKGVEVAGEAMVEPFAAVEAARTRSPEVSLTYFEFTLLGIADAIRRAHAAGEVDVVILEVGLGGRLDAVNLFDADCSVITSIDLDHMDYLGPTREAIGGEKAHIMRPGKPAVVSDPVPPQSVMDHAAKIGADLWLNGRDFNFNGDKQQWNWAGRGRRYSGLGYPALRGANQLLNASGALAAVEALRRELPVTAQAVRNGLAFVELPGRFQLVPGQPAVVLDVAHNPHAVAALAENLDAMGFYPGTHAVFGAMADKDLEGVLKRIAPLVDRWYLADLPTPRAAKATDVAAKLQALGLQPSTSKSVAKSDEDTSAEGGFGIKIATKQTAAAAETLQVFADPFSAFEAALAAADPADRILVFGSFYTVGGVLEHGMPALRAKHLPSK